MRVKSYTLTGAAAANNAAFAALQLPTAGTPLTLAGAAAAISPPREVTLTSAGNLSAGTYAIVGKDRFGNPQSESITGPNANTVRGKGVYSSITSITPNTTDGAVTVSSGFPARVVSPWVILNTIGATDTVPTARVQSNQVQGQAYAAGEVEVTNQNGNRDGAGEMMDPASTPAALAAAGAVVDAHGTYLRIVMTGTAGQLKVSIARPGF